MYFNQLQYCTVELKLTRARKGSRDSKAVRALVHKNAFRVGFVAGSRLEWIIIKNNPHCFAAAVMTNYHADLYKAGERISGVYAINPDDGDPLDV